VDEGRVIDYVGGKEDLRARLIRTIGNPDVRMREDPVRILRAIRFASKCAFELEPNTLAAMKAHVHEIPRCAPPRVLEEVLKLVRSGASRQSFELLRSVGALRILLPPVAAYLERRGPEEAERHLRALDALDAHVRVGEIPSDAVLLATLLAPLPRDSGQRGANPKASQMQSPTPATEKDDEDLERELTALEAADAAEPEDPAQAPLPEGALREAAEIHDERLGSPPFAGEGDVQPWSLPQDVVAPEIVLSEMMRTARLPRRIAERARMILLAQPILSGERRRRRSSPQTFARQSYFPEALAVFELSVAATGQGHEQLAKWQQIFAGQDLTRVAEGEERAEGGPPKRRSRGGRRRRGRGTGRNTRRG
jgi:poly(A) polymerase